MAVVSITIIMILGIIVASIRFVTHWSGEVERPEGVSNGVAVYQARAAQRHAGATSGEVGKNVATWVRRRHQPGTTQFRIDFLPIIGVQVYAKVELSQFIGRVPCIVHDSTPHVHAC